jgi:DNA repair exonuclease SbcCD ATPase subunit
VEVKNMAGLTEGLKSAFAGYVQGLLANPEVAKQLDSAGFPAKRRLDEIARAQETFTKKESEYRELVARKRAAADAANKALDDYYNRASAVTDQVVGTLGKNAALSKEIRNWRDRMVLEARRGQRKPSA